MKINPKSNFNKGVYNIKNKSKYIGKNTPVYRSEWERVYMGYLDNSDVVVRWGSESIAIPYRDPHTLKMRKYYIDFVVVLRSGRRILVEIKPFSQTKPPRKTKNKKRSTIIYEERMYKNNQAKWSSAVKYCQSRGWEFKVITEKNFKF
jgi:hypothetical protein